MDPEPFVFLDETGATPTLTHWQTTRFVAGLRASGIVAPWVIGGAMDGPAFRTDVEPVLVPEVRQADVVVMDNLPAHTVPACGT